MSKSIIVQGVRYPSITAACEAYGLDKNIANMRVTRLKWDLEVAIITPANPHTRSVLLDGKLYTSLREVAEEYDISHRLIIGRLNAGWSLEDAVTTPLRQKRTSPGIRVYVRGVYYPSIAEAAKSYDLRPDTVYMRLRYGWSLEDAVTTPLKQRKI